MELDQIFSVVHLTRALHSLLDFIQNNLAFLHQGLIDGFVKLFKLILTSIDLVVVSESLVDQTEVIESYTSNIKLVVAIKFHFVNIWG